MSEINIGARLMVRRKTAAEWSSANPVLKTGEVGYESDTRKAKVGDGVTGWNALGYAFGGESGGDSVSLAMLDNGLQITVTKADGTVQTGEITFETLKAVLHLVNSADNTDMTKEINLHGESSGEGEGEDENNGEQGGGDDNNADGAVRDDVPTDEGVYIYAELNGASGKFCTVDDWSTLSSQGYEAIGIVVVSDGHALMIATDEAASTMHWLESTGDTGGTLTSATSEAKADYNGADNTQKAYDFIASHSDAEGGSYAICYAHLYSKGSFGAGQWYLPALGEALLFAAYYSEINAALDAVGGTELSTSYYWTSTQYSSTYAWYLYYSSGLAYDYYKVDTNIHVRAVAAF